MTIYLDTNVVVALFIEDAHSLAAETLLQAHGADFTVSDLVTAEFAGVMGRRFRSGRLTRMQALAALDDFDVWRRSGVSVAALDATDSAPRRNGWGRSTCPSPRPTPSISPLPAASA